MTARALEVRIVGKTGIAAVLSIAPTSMQEGRDMQANNARNDLRELSIRTTPSSMNTPLEALGLPASIIE